MVSLGETLLIRYDENNKEFYYQTLSFISSLRDCYGHAFAYWNHCIFIFGGYSQKKKQVLNSIWKFDIKKEKSCCWEKCELKMPFEIYGAVAVVSKSDSSIHVIGGMNGKSEYQSTHYVMSVVKQYIFLREKKINK